MKAIEVIFIIGAIICLTLEAIFRIVKFPVYLVSDSLEAMAGVSRQTAKSIFKRVKDND